METIGVPFELAIVAGEIGSYKPAHRHWEAFFEQTGADRPATSTSARASSTTSRRRRARAPTIWINRLGEEPEPQPDVELHTLDGPRRTPSTRS